MKKCFKLLILLSLTCFLNVCQVSADFDCTLNDINPKDFSSAYFNVPYDMASGMIYEITYADIIDDVFTLYGWAFNDKYDSIMGNPYNPIGRTDKTTWIGLSVYDANDNTRKEVVPFNIEYAEPTNKYCSVQGCKDGSPKYFDYTYWNCVKHGNYGSRECIIRGTTYGNTYGDLSPILQGGFKATLNIKDLYENGTLKKDTEYRINVYIGRMGSATNPDDAWATYKERDYVPVDLSIAKAVVSDNVTNYKSTSNSGEPVIDISGFGDTAQMNVKYGIPIGERGLTCTTSFAQENTAIYYNLGKNYAISDNKDDIIKSCRGPECNTKNSPGEINLYPLKVNKNVTTQSGLKIVNPENANETTYAPASWLNFSGHVSFKITDDGPEKTYPDDCAPGTDRQVDLYYLFPNFVESNYKGEYRNSGFTFNVAQGQIFGNEIKLSNGEKLTSNIKNIESGDYSAVVDADAGKYNLNYFYRYLKLLKTYPTNHYIKASENEYFLAADQWCKISDSKEECENNTNWINFMPLESDNSYLATAILDNNKKGESRVTHRDVGLGYRFTLNSKFDRLPHTYALLSNNRSGTVEINGKYYHTYLSVYRISLCMNEVPNEPDPPSCADYTESPECSSSSTKLVFKESDNLKACTLEQGNDSGFTIVNNDYCSVACKDDIEADLPGEKSAIAGQYFVLDTIQNKPLTIKAKRTCVKDEKKKYDSFQSTLSSLGESVKSTYNTWQDWVYIQNQASSIIQPSPQTVWNGSNTHTSTSSNVSEEDKDSTCTKNESDPGDSSGKTTWTCSTTVTYYKIDITGPNSMASYKANPLIVGTGYKSSKYYSSLEDLQERVNQIIESNVEDAKTAYDAAVFAYNKEINNYNSCFNWTDTTSSGLKDYKFKFNPTVTFSYEDQDATKIGFNKNGSIYTYEYPKKSSSDIASLRQSTNTYWMNDPGESYTASGGRTAQEGAASSNKNIVSLGILNCSGSTCNNSDLNSTTFYRSSYIKREEMITLEYNLPQVYTTIPSGIVGLTVDRKLEKNAVPVNINTKEGNYKYKISITDIKDSVRNSTLALDRSQDHFDTRFKEKIFSITEPNYVCNYDVKNDIYIPSDPNTPNTPGKLNFFYRVVDSGNINPLNRALGYNWTSSKANKVIEIMKEDAASYDTLTNSRDKFVYTLTPVTMQAIRKYNASTTNGYSDWDLVCSSNENGNGYYCKSNFLTCLASGGKENIEGQPSCNEIFENSLNGYEQRYEYDLDELNDNRDILMKKPKILEGGS